MDEKPELIAFGENKLGGVQSYYAQLLLHDPFNHFDKLWILTDHPASRDARLPQLFNSCKEVIYKMEGEFEDVVRNLSQLISNRPGIVITNHEIELVALHRHRRDHKTIIYVCHDELYLHNALRYEFLIDVYVAHNIHFFRELKRLLPVERHSDIYYLPYGVNMSKSTRLTNTVRPLTIVFIARLHEKKGVYDLSKIDEQLTQQQVYVQWKVIGDGPEKARLKELLKDNPRFQFYSPPNSAEVIDIASTGDIFLLPSYLDGMPVALLEAMSAGLVPLVSKFNEGVTEVVKPDNGFVVPVGDVAGFAQKILELNADREKMESMSRAAREKIRCEFEIEARTKDYFVLFDKYLELKKKKRYKYINYFGRLDYPFIPRVLRDLYKSLTTHLK